MSKDLLLLGGTELDVATLYRETEAAMLQTKKREVALNKRLFHREKLLADRMQNIKKINLDLKTRSQQLLTNKQELNLVNNQLGDQKKIITDNEQMLTAAAEQLITAKQRLEQQKSAIKQDQVAHQAVMKRIDSNKIILQEQQLSLAKQTEQLNEKNLALIKFGETIDTQKKTITIVSVLIIIALAFTLLVIVLFIKNKNTTVKLSHALNNLEKSQNQLIESEKMAALGSLVAGVAHEINTPIGICVTASSHLNESVVSLEKDFQSRKMTKAHLKKFIDESSQLSVLILNNLNRAAELILSFKRVSVEQTSEQLHNLKVKETLLDIVNSSKPKFKRYDVEFIITCPEDIVLNSYPGIVAQILANFINNSFEHGFDKKVSGGIINITVTAKKNDYFLRYQDNGKGISAENLPKILEPFYTTNREFGGSGLGLNIVYNLIRNKLESEVNYGSTLGDGTWFEMTLKNLK
jgi:signal transduction histidine kinase